MKKSLLLHHGLIVACMALIVPVLSAQTSIQLFGPVNVRASVDGTTYDAPNTFNSTTLNLTCPASPTAVLSSLNGGNVLVDNNIQVSTGPPSVTGPTNVCTGGTSDSISNGGTSQNCFTSVYEGPAGNGQLVGQDPDSFAASSGVTLANGGVAPIDIHNILASGANQITISEVDGGGYLASSSLYLNTNCTQGGVTGGGSITGNPIPQTNPSPQQLTQSFTFNTGTGQQVQFTYDLSGAQAADTLAIQDGTIPGVEDAAIDPTTFQSVYGQDTPFSTSSCLIHTGEQLPNGQPACKLFTLECTVGTDSAESGANCPISSAPNELFQDIFDGPSFSLQDISTPHGPTFHEGIGFLMASEPWNGGPCAFDPASGLGNLPCPQNLLANFSGPGIYTGSSYTSHPNSTFILVTGVPEPLTTVTVANQQQGGWVNSRTPNVTFSSQPPNLSGLTESQLSGVSKFAAAPIQSITYGTAAVGSVPTPGVPGSVGTTIANGACPATIPPGVAQPAFTTPAAVTFNADGNFLLYYFAQDCAGTQELDFVEDGTTHSWSTSYYTAQINVDTMPPAVSSGPTLSPSSGSYFVGAPVTANYSCTDDRSGIVTCGASTYSADSAPLSTGPLTSPVSTSTPGNSTFTVNAVDAAGNKSSQSVNYVVTAYDSSIHVTLSQYTVTYPGGTNVVIQVSPTGGHTPTGTVKLYDGTTLLQSSGLQGNGATYLYIHGLNVGSHSLTASYSGDSNNAAGTSAPVILTVKPVPVQLSASCWNASFPYGADYHCGIYTSSAAGAPQGVVTYQYDGGATVTLPLVNGVANFIVPKPPVGNHTVVMGYAAQTNYAAANSSTVHFTVTKAPVILQLTPSTWYATGGNVTLSVAIQSWSAGPPNALGTVSFYNGNKLLATVPVTANGTASTMVTASSLGNGSRTLTASYSGSPNYASGTASVTITVAVK